MENGTLIILTSPNAKWTGWTLGQQMAYHWIRLEWLLYLLVVWMVRVMSRARVALAGVPGVVVLAVSHEGLKGKRRQD